MSGSILQVWFEPAARTKTITDGKPAEFELFETEFRGLSDFLAAVERDELISAVGLVTRYTAAPGEREVLRRYDTAFRGRAVLRAELPRWRIVEPAGA